jgi:multisubunit Na+/H+ antiporter MnhB subunit
VKKSNESWRPLPHASCGCNIAPTTSIKRTLHVSFTIIIQAWAFVLFYIAFAHLESTTSVKKSKKESWGVLSDASCGCAAAPTTSIQRTLHVSFALIIQAWAFVLFYIAFAHLKSTSSVKKSKKESWGVLSDASCGCAAAPTTSIKRTLHVSFALIIQEWAFVLWETNEILHCYWEDRIPQTASRERTWVDDHNFLASLNQNVVRASLAADVCSSAVTWYTMNATA